jgi:predicted lipoprotein with Yx(FWY)xxD motif
MDGSGIMSFRSRAVALGVVSAAVLAGSGWGVSSAFAAAQHSPKDAVVFRTEHVGGARNPVLVEGSGLVVYTFSGDTKGKAGTCTGQCASVWPPLHGTALLARGAEITGKFSTIAGQISYNGLPLYLFTGEKPGQNHADSAFKVIQIQPRVPAHTTAPAPQPSPTPTATSGGGW